MNCHQQSDWYRFHRDTATREPAAMAKKQNGDTIISNSSPSTNTTASHSNSQRSMDLLDLTRANETMATRSSQYTSAKQHHLRGTKDNAANNSHATSAAAAAAAPHDRDMIGSSSESKSAYAGRNNGHRNQCESRSDAVTHVVNHDAIVISDEDDDDDDDDDEHEYSNVGTYTRIGCGTLRAQPSIHPF